MKQKNIPLQKLIAELNKAGKDSPAYKRLAEELSKSRRSMPCVNLMKINKVARDGETVAVPGKVLAVGNLDKKVKVAAYTFSETAMEKLGNNALTLSQLIKDNPKAQKVRIMK